MRSSETRGIAVDGGLWRAAAWAALAHRRPAGRRPEAKGAKTLPHPDARVTDGEAWAQTRRPQEPAEVRG